VKNKFTTMETTAIGPESETPEKYVRSSGIENIQMKSGMLPNNPSTQKSERLDWTRPLIFIP